MSTVLVKGQNTPLTARKVQVTVEVAGPTDLSALLVTANGKVRTDADFVFYNQPQGPGVSCQQPAAGQWRVDVDLAAVPAEIDKVRAVVSMDGSGQRFGQFPPPTARVRDESGTELAQYVITGLETESIVVALELYRRGADWKLRAVGQGYAGGLADLIKDHGVSVDDEPAAQPAPTGQQARPPAPPAPPPPVQPQYQQPPAPPVYQQPPAQPQYQQPPAPPAGPVYGQPSAPPPAPAPAYGQPSASPQYTTPPATSPEYGQPAQYGPPPTQQYAPPAGQPPAPPPQPADQGLRPGAPVSLSKGQRVSLRKQDGAALSLVRMGLGWDPIKKRGLFGSREQDIDLDASAILFADKQPVDVAFFNHLRSNDGSVLHSGDNRTGMGEGDDESILVDLNRVPAHVTTIMFVVTSYEGHTFQQVEAAFCRLVDETTNGELARYTLSGGTPSTAMVMAKVYREGNAWKMMAIGEPAQGRTPLDLVPVLPNFL